MNNELFSQARVLYAEKDYAGALDAFTQCLRTSTYLEPGETGLLYHQIGNCLIKLKNSNEAIQAYSQAVADEEYDAFGTVSYNLGMAYAALHDFENAVLHFENAISDSAYATPYKAYIAMGNALMKMGDSAKAGVAFREAALDEANPDPTKALLNLGVCFMALNRANDAVASYESALQFNMSPDMLNKLYANLGQAYVASGRMQDAVNAFERSIADKTYFLSDSASVDYQRAIAVVSQGTSAMTQVLPAAADMSGLDVSADGMPVRGDYDYQDDQDSYYYNDLENGVDPDASERFFNATDEELELWSKSLVKQERKRKNVGLKIVVVIVVLLLLAFAGAAFAYTQGFGYPSQEQVVKQLFADPDAAKSSLVADGVSESTVSTMLEPVVEDDNVAIDYVDMSMSNSTAYVTATTPEGGQVEYKVSLVRDMIGWKVSNVELYFASQN